MANEVSEGLFAGTITSTSIIDSVKCQEPLCHHGQFIDPIKEFVPVFLQCLRKQLLTRIGTPLIKPTPITALADKRSHITSKSGKTTKPSPFGRKQPVSSPQSTPTLESFASPGNSSGLSRRSQSKKSNLSSKRGKHNKGNKNSYFSAQYGSPSTVETPTASTRGIKPINFELEDEDEFPSLAKPSAVPSKTSTPIRRITLTSFPNAESNDTKKSNVDTSFGDPFADETVTDTKSNTVTCISDKFSKLEMKMRHSDDKVCQQISGNKGISGSFDKRAEKEVFSASIPQHSSANIMVHQKKVALTGNSTEENDLKLDSIKDITILTTLIAVYTCILSENLVSNLMLEFSFLFQVMLASGKQDNGTSMDVVDVFLPLANCIYFAVKSLESMKRYSALSEKLQAK